MILDQALTVDEVVSSSGWVASSGTILAAIQALGGAYAQNNLASNSVVLGLVSSPADVGTVRGVRITSTYTGLGAGPNTITVTLNIGGTSLGVTKTMPVYTNVDTEEFNRPEWDGPWTKAQIDAATVTVSVTCQQAQNGILDYLWAEIDYDLGTVATPTFSDSGEVLTTDEITISCATEGATIYYTTDGSTPEPGEGTTQEYTEHLHVEEAQTIKAIATKADWADSAVASASFTVAQVATPTITPNGGTVLETDTITLACATEGVDLWYQIDDGDPVLYRNADGSGGTGPFTLSESCTVIAQGLADGYDDSDIVSADFIVVEGMAQRVILMNGGDFD